MENSIPIEAVRMVQSRMQSIEARMGQVMERRKTSGFKDVLFQTVHQFREELEKPLQQATQKVGTVSQNITEKITEGIKDIPDFDHILSLVDSLSQKIGVDPDLVKAMIKVESNFDPQATSPAGAMGLMQLMPATANALGVDQPYDIEQNLTGGIKLIKSLTESFDGDLSLALAAYNAGGPRVREYGGIPPIEETQNYVKKVLSLYDPHLG